MDYCDTARTARDACESPYSACYYNGRSGACNAGAGNPDACDACGAARADCLVASGIFNCE